MRNGTERWTENIVDEKEVGVWARRGTWCGAEIICRDVRRNDRLTPSGNAAKHVLAVGREPNAIEFDAKRGVFC
ncbi:hypothetical protein CKO51_28080 [Rhodopirellula sp. SM50]|nr:hypothetical protein CKO51_28080 [Rhodopirellula sp. SM50]